MTEFDLAPDFDFQASLREAEEQALAAEPETTAEAPEPEVVVEETPEPVAEETTDERPRNPDGTFAPKNPEPETAAEQLLAGRFKTQAELEKGYLELLKLDGQKSNELGELRRVFEERMQAFEDKVSQPAPTRITQDVIDQDPAVATQLAWQQQDQYALGVAFEAWKDEDPGAAASWAAARHIEQREAQIRQEFEERFAQMEQRFQPYAEASREQELMTHTREVLAKHPDVQTFIENGMVGEIAQEFPDIGLALASGDPVRTAKAVQAAVEIAKGRVAGNLEAISTSVEQNADASAARAREEAFVASATQTSTPPLKTVEEEEQDRFANRIQSQTQVWDSGWDRG